MLRVLMHLLSITRLHLEVTNDAMVFAAMTLPPDVITSIGASMAWTHTIQLPITQPLPSSIKRTLSLSKIISMMPRGGQHLVLALSIRQIPKHTMTSSNFKVAEEQLLKATTL